MTQQPVGTFCLVLHSHLPWLAHHGTWPVGEEWLHQAWSASYLPVVEVLDRLATEGRRELLTLGVTPVLGAQLDDPYCLREMHTWLGLWWTRAGEAASTGDPHRRRLAAYEAVRARTALATFETRWSHGGSPILRRLADAGAVELLGGPATHPFLPLLDERVAAFALGSGLDDAALRAGRRPHGVWSPECGYRPGLERMFASQGVSHFLVDEATFGAAGRVTSSGWDVAGSGVVAYARDLAVTNRIWSSRRGYPTGSDYRDFHVQDALGFRTARVTSLDTPADRKAPYDPAGAAAAVERDAVDFVDAVRRRLAEIGARDGGGDSRGRRGGRARAPLVVAAYDTELFGHWWHEGPAFLDRILRLLPQAGVRLRTLRGALEDGLVGGGAELGAGSWGAGKDFRVWAGEAVADITTRNGEVQRRLLAMVDRRTGDVAVGGRRRALDQLAREALLCLSSDWAFMVSRDSAADYARGRSQLHAGRFHRLADALEGGDGSAAVLSAEMAAVDNVIGSLDARLLARAVAAPDVTGAGLQ